MALRNPEFGVYAESKTRIELLKGHLDGFESEEHTLETEMTTFPVEDGRLLTDNLVKQQRKITLRAVVSEYSRGGKGPSDIRPGVAWREIDKIYRDRKPLTVITPLRKYDNVILTRASAPVDAQSGRGALNVTLEFTEILSATVERVYTQEEVDQANVKARELLEDRGFQPLTIIEQERKLELLLPEAKRIEFPDRTPEKTVDEEQGDRWAGVKSAVVDFWKKTGVNQKTLRRRGGVQDAIRKVEILTLDKMGESTRQQMRSVVSGQTIGLGMTWLPSVRKWHTSIFDGAGVVLSAGMALVKHGRPLKGTPTGVAGAPPGEIVVVGTTEPNTPDEFSSGNSSIAFVSPVP